MLQRYFATVLLTTLLAIAGSSQGARNPRRQTLIPPSCPAFGPELEMMLWLRENYEKHALHVYASFYFFVVNVILTAVHIPQVYSP